MSEHGSVRVPTGEEGVFSVYCDCGAAWMVRGAGTDWVITPLKPSPREGRSSSAEVEPAGRWIPVSDGLPDDENDVLVYLGDGDMEVWSYNQSRQEWFPEDVRGEVTHWRPLPQPPTNE